MFESTTQLNTQANPAPTAQPLVVSAPIQAMPANTRSAQRISHEQVLLIEQNIQAELRNTIGAGTVFESNSETVEQITDLTHDICAQLGYTNPEDIAFIRDTCVADLTGYGALEPLLDDSSISEIIVNGTGQNPDGSFKEPMVIVEQRGKLIHRADIPLYTNDELMRIIERIGEQIGRRCDQSSPLMDARLPDGSRVNATHACVSPDGATLNIRKFKKDLVDAEALLKTGSMTLEMMQFLASAVAARASIIVSGGTGSGKTTMLNVLANFIAKDEFVITIEDTNELQLPHPLLRRHEAKAANIEGAGAVSINDLLINALRERPDRIIVGECRDASTYTMMQAAQTGHDGSMTTIHANDCEGCFIRIESMITEDKPNITSNSVRMQIAQAFDLVVQVKRYADGSRRVDSITAIEGFADGVIARQELFHWDSLHKNPDGSTGAHVKNGYQPQRLKQRILESGKPYQASWFIN